MLSLLRSFVTFYITCNFVMQGEFQKSFHTVNLLDGVNGVNCFYYMADSASGQDDANPVF